ncbi:MAG: glucose-6-phosphate isomerase [Pseudomonadota bacterium]
MTLTTQPPAPPGDRRASVPASTLPPYTQDLSGCDAHALGRDDLAGLVTHDIDAAVRAAVAALRAEFAAGGQPILQIASARDDIAPARAALEQLSAGARTLVFFGTGGSSLGGQMLAQAGGWNIPGDRGDRRRDEHRDAAADTAPNRPRIRFYDNLDGRTLGRALQHLDLETTRFVVTSKSGNTPETLLQMLAALQAIRDAQLTSRIPELFLAVSEPEAGRPNGLRALANSHQIPCLDHPTDIGGRFSALTIVGLLPAMARGLDPVAIREGAAAVVGGLDHEDPSAWAPAGGAVTLALLQSHAGIRAFVLMPYADRLARLAAWYAQLFGESLGKDLKGGTPVAALGPVDQHSQLQLWMDGPREHLVTFVREAAEERGPIIDPELAGLAGLDYMAGRPVGALVDAQARAVPEALRRAGRPHRVFDVDAVDEFSVGGLAMHFMIETVLLGAVMGVDPYDQPAVEIGKRLARGLLSTGDT